MDHSRIETVIDIPRMRAAKIAIIGAGGSAGLVNQLVRSGAGQLMLIDPDIVSPSNVARQAHDPTFLGRSKVEALAATLLRINRDLRIIPLVRDITTIPDAEIDDLFGGCDLIVNATDRFRAAAKGNEIALRLGISSIWVGLYPEALGGEIAFWRRSLFSCYRCLCAKRYAAHEKAEREGRSLDPASDGCTIFDITLLDSIAGMIAVGLLTAGADNRFGRLIEQLGDRNFLQIQLNPTWNLSGRNPIRELLGVDPDCPTFFAWNTIVRSDPDRGQLLCPDCERFRGHRFVQDGGQSRRIIPSFMGESDAA